MNKIKMMDNKLIRLSYLKKIKKNELVKNFSYVGIVGDVYPCKEFKINLIDNSTINIFVRVNKKKDIDKIKSINYNKIVSS